MAGRLPVWCPPAWDKVAFEWESKTGRAEAAVLRRLADGLDGGERVEIEHAGWELGLEVGDNVELEIEVESDGPGTEVEIELSWSTRDGGVRGRWWRRGCRERPFPRR